MPRYEVLADGMQYVMRYWLDTICLLLVLAAPFAGMNLLRLGDRTYLVYIFLLCY